MTTKKSNPLIHELTVFHRTGVDDPEPEGGHEWFARCSCGVESKGYSGQGGQEKAIIDVTEQRHSDTAAVGE